MSDLPHSKRRFDDDLADNRILSFSAWCDMCGISQATGRRLIRAGRGPKFVRISDKRIGVSVAENRRWQEGRAINPAT